MGKTLISSYARVKPLGKGYSDKDGGTKSGKRITGWDEGKGEISINNESIDVWVTEASCASATASCVKSGVYLPQNMVKM